ncbi:MAG: SBBP repeat-containing protein [PVC group bacterium]
MAKTLIQRWIGVALCCLPCFAVNTARAGRGTSANHPPDVECRSDIKTFEIEVGDLLEFKVKASDPDGDKLEFSTNYFPPGASFDPREMAFKWCPEKSQQGKYLWMGIHATDEKDAVSRLCFNVSVNPARASSRRTDNNSVTKAADGNRPPVLELQKDPPRRQPEPVTVDDDPPPPSREDPDSSSNPLPPPPIESTRYPVQPPAAYETTGAPSTAGGDSAGSTEDAVEETSSDSTSSSTATSNSGAYYYVAPTPVPAAVTAATPEPAAVVPTPASGSATATPGPAATPAPTAASAPSPAPTLAPTAAPVPTAAATATPVPSPSTSTSPTPGPPDLSLEYSTYFGGSSDDYGLSIAVDSLGSFYMAGYTASPDFPDGADAYQGIYGGGVSDVFITRFNSFGAVEYSTFLGGSGEEVCWGLAVDEECCAYLTGHTHSQDFPTLNSYQASNTDIWEEVFVAKLNSAGSALIYSTYLGGTGFDMGRGIAVGPTREAIVAGWTDAPNFPTSNPYQAVCAGSDDAFIARFTSSGRTLVFSTYLGGSQSDEVFGMALDSGGDVYVAGATYSVDFPLVNPYQAASGGNPDGFFFKLSSSGRALLYSSYLGGTAEDGVDAIAVDGELRAYLTGFTNSADFPLRDPYQSTISSPVFQDGFVTRIDSTGSTLSYSTYLGGEEDERLCGIAADSAGCAYVVGITGADDFPVLYPYQSTRNGGSDAFITKLNSSGAGLIYSSYLGGSGNDVGAAVALDSSQRAYLTGWTDSSNFPTMNPRWSSLAGGDDAIAVQLLWDP